MKLRIKGNSLRMRLSQTEVDKFGREGLIKDQIQFGQSTLTYLLEVINSDNVEATLETNIIRVGVPEAVKNIWMDEGEVGFEARIGENEDELYVLVEKDFQCLVPRKEDESDLYENPKTSSN